MPWTVGDQLEMLAASPDPRNPWWELRIIRLLASRDEPRPPVAPPLERAA